MTQPKFVPIAWRTPEQKREAKLAELLDTLYEETMHRALCKPSQAETHTKAIRAVRAEIMTLALTPGETP